MRYDYRTYILDNTVKSNTKVKVLVNQSVFDSSGPHGLSTTRFLCSWNSPSKNTGVGCHSLLQGIFPAQGSNPLQGYPALQAD